VIFGAFRTTLDVVVVQPFWFEQGMFAVLKLCLFRTECNFNYHNGSHVVC
jgi:hypothetical protein